MPTTRPSTESTLRTARVLCAVVALIYPLFWVVSNHFRHDVVDPWPPYVAIEIIAVIVLGALFRVRRVLRAPHIAGATLLFVITAHTFYLLVLNRFHQMYLVATLGLVMMASAIYRYALPTHRLALSYLGSVITVALVLRAVMPSSNLNYFTLLLSAFCILALVTIRSQIMRDGELAASEERFRQLSDASLEGVALLRNGKIIDANMALMRLFGRTRGALLGRSLIDLCAPASRDDLVRYIRGHWTAPTVEVVSVDGRGERLIVEINCRELGHSDGTFSVAVLRDITDRKRVEEGLERERRLAVAQNEAKSAFLAQMSHELRTPLNAVIGFSELLATGGVGDLTEDQQELARDILHSGEHLLALISDILDLSKIEAGRMTVSSDTVALGPLMRDVITVLGHQAQSKAISVSIGCDLPDLVRLDGRKVKQILVNLLSNAIKFTDRGGAVTLRGQLEQHEGQDRILLQVSDTGIGIDATHIERIFQPFEQVETSLARNYDGTGLGLTLVERLAQMLGGTVTARSRPGVGSTFDVRLPCVVDSGASLSGAPNDQEVPRHDA